MQSGIGKTNLKALIKNIAFVHMLIAVKIGTIDIIASNNYDFLIGPAKF